MDTGTIELAVPAGLTSSQVRGVLGDQFSCSSQPVSKTRRTYLDTFDWRVYADGGVVESTPKNKKLKLTWVGLNGAERLGPFTQDRQPCFIDDISSLPLRRRLTPVVEMRALLPQFEVLSEVESLALLDGDRKTVVRVQLVTERVPQSYKGKPLDSTSYLKVIPLRGYGKASERAVQILSEAFDVVEIEGDFILRTLTRLKRLPVDPSKLRVDLSSDMRSETALKTVLLHLLNTMEINEAGTKTNIDSEFLHDFRVAVRRTRSALSQVKGVFPAEILEQFAPEFRWLGGITGPTRDLDVYLLSFDEYKNSLPDFQQQHLEPLRHFLQVHHQMEQQNMATCLGSSRYRTLMRDWRAFLQSADTETTELPNAALPIADVVSARTWRVYKLAVKEGRAIGPESPAEQLHDLRKTCKKLRYLMEIFQSLYPPAKLKKLIKALKVLQENLGDFQDLEVQAETLRKFGQQMMDEDHVGVDTIFAMGTLISGLNRRQRKARDKFSRCFDEFVHADNRALFKQVFNGRPKQAQAVLTQQTAIQ